MFENFIHTIYFGHITPPLPVPPRPPPSYSLNFMFRIISWDRDYPYIGSLPVQLDWLASKPRGSFCRCFSRAVITDAGLSHRDGTQTLTLSCWALHRWSRLPSPPHALLKTFGFFLSIAHDCSSLLRKVNSWLPLRDPRKNTASAPRLQPIPNLHLVPF